MFSKILIANRGEIACRVISTARRMGISTVAVYSGADAASRHVAMADEAIHIGPAPVGESYLKGDRIIQAALDTGAQAIHPGYGFLSENPDFVKAVTAAGLTFIGPSEDAIRAMGLKDAAKVLMEKAGVPVVPGYHGARQEPDFLAEQAGKIGYPVLIKARAGGGGKGMRLVERPADFADALQSASREAAASFGDPACLIEKYITRPRHIEVQVFGDTHGNAIHLFERDCSLQRRHQKVIEEAPAPDMTPDVRAAMGKAAVDAAKAIGYAGAGTVEFIVDGANGLRPDGFWFMEMNTRLQVEHPVTEAVTGLDLVEMQLQVAAGAPLPVWQEDLSLDGHAFEARIYAEDVPAGFLPSTGTLTHLVFPSGADFARGDVRIDSGVRAGDVITPFYDPMIAKLVVHGPDRQVALARLSQALEACRIAGSVTNLAFLGRLAADPDFAAGRVDTGLIARNLDDLTAPDPVSTDAVACAALVALGLLERGTGFAGFRHWGTARASVALNGADGAIPVAVDILGPDRFVIDGTVLAAHRDGDRVTIASNGHVRRFDVVRSGQTVTVFDQGRTSVFGIADPLEREDDAAAGADTVLAPMPGLIKEVRVAAGQAVKAGAPLLMLEAMKMEHTLTAPRDGTVAEITAAAGDQVDAGKALVLLEPLDG